VLVDQSKDAVKIIQKNAEKTRLSEDCTVICSDFAEFLRQRRGKDPFDIVFIDPPYAMRACKAAVEALLENRLLKPHSILVLESAEPDPLGVGTPLSEKFEVVKSARYGAAYVNILTPKA
jgi:16S rRNA (guanine966-N2)-methyltransferase